MRNGSAGGEVAVVVPAAGTGRRMGGEPKQFRRLGDRPLVVQALLAFERHPRVRYLAVAAPPDRCTLLEEELKAAGITKTVAVVRGGATRQDSVAAALRTLPDAVDVVLVHDAVRPFVRAEHVSAVIDAVLQHGAAALAIPTTDTLRRAEGRQFGETVPRAKLYRMQTPQGFRRNLFEEAHREAARHGWQVTDDVALVMELGRRVHIVEGSTTNFKITTPADWELARLYWPRWSKELEKKKCALE